MTGVKGNKKKKKVVPAKPTGTVHPAPTAPSASPATAPSAAAVPPPKPATGSANTVSAPGISATSASRASNISPTAGAGAGAGAATKPKPSLDPAALILRAQKLKEEGNRQFAERQFSDAFRIYEVALKFIPEGHADRAVLYSNRAACLLQIKPVDYEGVIKECNLALKHQSNYHRALLRRARAYEALGRSTEAEEDLKLVLQVEPGNRDAVELLAKIEGQKVAKETPTVPVQASETGASMNGDRGPSLPPKPSPKQGATSEKSDVTGQADEVEEVQQPGQPIVLDDWFLELAEMIRMRLGIDPTRSEQFDFNFAEINRAIDEVVSSEEASPLLQLAEAKFMNMSAMVLINWASSYKAIAQKKSAKPTKGVEVKDLTEEQKQQKDVELEGSAKDGTEVEMANGVQEKQAGGAEEGREEKEDGAQGISDVTRELADCDWTLKHLEIALEKYEAALNLQPGMVDALAGMAHCLSDRARTVEKRAELLLTTPGGPPLNRQLAVKVQEDYEAARTKFAAAKEVLDKIEKDFMEQPKNHRHCNNPDHHHPPPANGEETGGETAEEDPQDGQFLDNVSNFRQQMYSHWASALSSAAHFEYKLGRSEWKTDLQRAAELKKEMGETDEQIAEFFARHAVPLSELKKAMTEKDEEQPDKQSDVDDESLQKGMWANVWASVDLEEKKIEEDVKTDKVSDKSVVTDSVEEVPEGRVHAGVPVESENKENEVTSSESKQITSSENKEQEVASSENKEISENKGQEVTTSENKEQESTSSELDAGKTEKVSDKKADREASTEGAIKSDGPGSKKEPKKQSEPAAGRGKGKGKKFVPAPKEVYRPPQKQSDGVSIKVPDHGNEEKKVSGKNFDGDEPMTPVKDLVGKFTSLLNQ